MHHSFIRYSYTTQFQKGPPPFSGALPTMVRLWEVSVLSHEIVLLLEKGAIDEIPPAQTESGFYSRYFIVPEKNGVYIQFWTWSFKSCAQVNKFKMLMMSSILSHIQPGDWFVTIDLKDAYFHIQIVKRHRKFLRFAFKGKAYQF